MSQHTIQKRRKMLDIVKETEMYKQCMKGENTRCSTLHISVPSTPRCDVPKRQWEHSFYKWRTSLKSLASLQDNLYCRSNVALQLQEAGLLVVKPCHGQKPVTD